MWFKGALFGGNPQAKLLWKYHRCVYSTPYLFRVTHDHQCRAIGYATFGLLLLTAYLGGAWSNWSQEHSASIPRFFAYTFAPVALIASVYSRIRHVLLDLHVTITSIAG